MKHRDATNVVRIGLSAAIVSVADDSPHVLVVRQGDGAHGLPFGPFDPLSHRTFEAGLRAWVAEQTALKLGHVEQLYTFGDRGRHAEAAHRHRDAAAADGAVDAEPHDEARGDHGAGHVTDRAEREHDPEIDRCQPIKVLQHE